VNAWLVQGGGTERLVAHVGYTAAVLGVSLLLALVSWRVLESPLLSLKRYYPMPTARLG
jgi:peptidoglycan/LPS O-acetylase OafA/YrhL